MFFLKGERKTKSFHKIGCGSAMKIKIAFFFSLRSPCTIFVYIFCIKNLINNEKS